MGSPCGGPKSPPADPPVSACRALPDAVPGDCGWQATRAIDRAIIIVLDQRMSVPF